MPRLGVYIHWPFCRSKCPYCDFFSRVKKDVDQAAIVDGYLADLEYYRGLNDGYTVDSVFFGGGTPSAATTLRVIGRLSALPTESGGMVKAPVRSAAIVTFQI